MDRHEALKCEPFTFDSSHQNIDGYSRCVVSISIVVLSRQYGMG